MTMSLTYKSKLEKCIKEYLAEEPIDGSYTCEKCKRNSPAKVRHELKHLPKYLVFHIKRFDSVFNKIKSNTQYPLHLDMR
jgi:ubiquitin C-terminal hydrolase